MCKQKVIFILATMFFSLNLNSMWLFRNRNSNQNEKIQKDNAVSTIIYHLNNKKLDKKEKKNLALKILKSIDLLIKKFENCNSSERDEVDSFKARKNEIFPSEKEESSGLLKAIKDRENLLSYTCDLERLYNDLYNRIKKTELKNKQKLRRPRSQSFCITNNVLKELTSPVKGKRIDEDSDSEKKGRRAGRGGKKGSKA